MTTSYNPNSEQQRCKIIVPITIKVPILLEIEIVGIPPTCQLQQQIPEPYNVPVEEPDPNSREFIYEVVGMHHNGENCPIRHSGTMWISVPFNRMMQEMQRIVRLGGKIITVKPKQHFCPLRSLALFLIFCLLI
jgi:CpcD/allophycocyanin linker domain